MKDGTELANQLLLDIGLLPYFHFPMNFLEVKRHFTQKMWPKNKVLNMDNLCKVIPLMKDGTELANRLLLDIGLLPIVQVSKTFQLTGS